MPKRKRKRANDGDGNLLNLALRSARKRMRELQRGGILHGLSTLEIQRVTFSLAESYLDGGREALALLPSSKK